MCSFNYHFKYGPFSIENDWVPAPRYLMRRNRVFDLISPISPGRVLEIGCGAGALIYELSLNGWQCEALETSRPAYDLARKLNKHRKIKFHCKIDPSWNAHFDLMISNEVLEHIEEDKEVLTQWRQWLKPRGTLILSVPCHRKKWNYSDIWAGHYRRYEKKSLISLLSNAGFSINRFECYGFPLTNLIESIRSCYYKILLKNSGYFDSIRDNYQQQNTDKSGISRKLETKVFPIYSSWAGIFVMEGAIKLQRLFLDKDWGNGYLVRMTRI